MITGNDISEFQGNIDWPVYKNNSNFVMMKAGEGSSYIDGEFGNNRTQARNVQLPRGFYHFARPDLGNTPEQEAQFFCNLIDGDPIQEGEVLALDYEEMSYSAPVSWCKGWLDFVSQHFNGIKPLLYLNQSLVKSYDWQSVIDAGYGLWLADYTYDPNKNSGETGQWPFMAMQQWTDQQQVPGIPDNVDGDCFFGTEDEFKAYGYKKVQPVPPQAEPAPVETNSVPPSADTTGQEPQQSQSPIQQSPDPETPTSTPTPPSEPVIPPPAINPEPTIPETAPKTPFLNQVASLIIKIAKALETWAESIKV